MSKETENKDLVIKEEGIHVPAEFKDEFSSEENMEGVTPRFPRIKILHQAQLFEFPDETQLKEFKGIILDTNRINAWWKESYDATGGGTPPDCFSLDGVHCDQNSAIPQSELCGTDKHPKCDQNKFGSDGRGKACKNMKRIHVILEGQMLPYRLTLPPTNLFAIDEYISILRSGGDPYQLIITKLSLKKAQNKDGIPYSLIQLRKVGAITDKPEKDRIKQMYWDFKPFMREQEIEFEEYKPEEKEI